MITNKICNNIERRKIGEQGDDQKKKERRRRRRRKKITKTIGASSLSTNLKTSRVFISATGWSPSALVSTAA